ncbi:MAG: tetratricopeptide repeat protein [Candidatus Latescibacteria bacterium]|nr:tetratricopeptide repeat protein [Candidatus Latescibacterota bacterium]
MKRWVLLLWCGLAACSRDAGDWHQKTQELIGSRVLRALPPAELAQATYCEEQSLALDSTRAETYLSLARLYRARGAYEDETRLWRALLAQHPDLSEAYAGLGASMAAQGRYNAASRAFQDAIRREYRTAAVYLQLGNVYQALGHVQNNLRSAEAAYQAALELSPNQPDVLLQLARIEVALKRPEDALRLYRQALELSPQDDGIRIELAALYKSGGATDMARQLLADGLAARPDDAVLSFELGRLWWELGDLARAQVQLQQARAQDSTLVEVYRYQGLIHSSQGRQDQALEAFRKLEAVRPREAAVKVNIGIVYSQQGDLTQAEQAFRAAVQLGGDKGDAALKLGGLYMHQVRLQEAVQIFKQAEEQYPANAEVHASLGEVYRQMGVLGGALDESLWAVELQPEKALWLYHLAAIYEQVDPAQARQVWARYLELAAPDLPEAQRLATGRQRLIQLGGWSGPTWKLPPSNRPRPGTWTPGGVGSSDSTSTARL